MKLLPCPFCGKKDCLRISSSFEDLLEYEGNEEYFTIVCDASTPNGLGGCGAMVGYKKTEELASKEWNNRTQLSAMQPSKPVAYRQHIEVTKNGVTTKEYGYSDIQIMEGDDALYLAPPSAEAKLLQKEG